MVSIVLVKYQLDGLYFYRSHSRIMGSVRSSPSSKIAAPDLYVMWLPMSNRHDIPREPHTSQPRSSPSPLIQTLQHYPWTSTHLMCFHQVLSITYDWCLLHTMIYIIYIIYIFTYLHNLHNLHMIGACCTQ